MEDALEQNDSSLSADGLTWIVERRRRRSLIVSVDLSRRRTLTTVTSRDWRSLSIGLRRRRRRRRRVRRRRRWRGIVRWRGMLMGSRRGITIVRGRLATKTFGDGVERVGRVLRSRMQL